MLLPYLPNSDSFGIGKEARRENSESAVWWRWWGRRLSPDSIQLNDQPERRASLARGWLAFMRGRYPLEPLASVATIIGTVVSVFGVLQSRLWLVLTSLLFVCVTVFAGLYARSARIALNEGSIMIEGHSIDSLNIANLRRRVNRTFVIQEAIHTARIEGEDLEITWKYSGYCRAHRESAMEFSIDSDDSTPFDKLNCFAYDLGHDPEMSHQIRPLLVGTEGISKKISVPFLGPVEAHQSFGLLLKCTLPRCVNGGFGYYTSTLSFAQDRVRRSMVRLIFAGSVPSWVRVYECLPQRRPVLVKTLAPFLLEPGLHEYVDEVKNREGNSARVYTFWRTLV
jgi:hypothetical protein